MNDKSKMFIAIFAVAIMIGGALVPLTYPSTEATVEDADDDTSSFSLATIIEKIKERGEALIEELDLGNARLVPTDVEMVGKTNTFDTTIKTAVEVKEGDTGKFASGSTTTFENGGKIIIRAGGMLELFPKDGATYTIANKDYADITPLIEMENGSILSILGMKFYVRISSIDNDKPTLGLFGMGKFKDSTSTVSSVFSYQKQTDSEKYVLSVKVGTNCRLGFMQDKYFESDDTYWNLIMNENNYKTEVKDGDKVITPVDHPDFSFTGTISGETLYDTSGSAEKATIKITATGFLLIDAKLGTSGYSLIQGHANIEKGTISIEALGTDDFVTYNISADVKATINAQVYAINVDKDKKETKVIAGIIDNALIQTGELKLTVSTGHEIVRFAFSEAGDLIISADNLMLDFAQIDLDFVNAKRDSTQQLKIADIKLSAKDVKVSGVIVYDLGGKMLPVSDLIVDIPSASLTINSATMVAKKLSPIAFDKEVTLTFVKDFAFSFQNVKVNFIELTNMQFDVGEISLKATVGKDLFKYIAITGMNIPFAYDATVNIAIKDLKAFVNIDTKSKSFGGKINASLGTLSIAATVTYEGVERNLQLSLENLDLTANLNKLTGKASIGKIYLKNDVPLRLIEKFIDSDSLKKGIRNIVALTGVGSADVELQINNLACEVDLEDYFKNAKTKIPELTADSLEVTLKNGTNYKEMYIKFSDNLVLDLNIRTTPIKTTNDDDYVFYGLKIKCGNVDGHYISYSNENNNFSVSDEPEVGLGVTEVTETKANREFDFAYMGAIKIFNGSAKFDAGKLPFAIVVASGASFSANGLTAPAFIFEGGCNKSGTVVLDTNGFELPVITDAIKEERPEYGVSTIYRMSIILDNGYYIGTNPENNTEFSSYTITDYAGGYKLTFDLSDLTTGKIEANAGKLLPKNGSDNTAWFNDSGFSGISSEDRLTGTFYIQKNAIYQTYLDIECESKDYKLSYADDYVASKTYKYGEEVTLAEAKTPKSEDLTFIGWTDGSGAIYKAESKYIMPARDVKMTPVYVKYVDDVKIGDDKKIVISATEVPAVEVDFTDVKDEEWTELTVKTANSTVTISRATYEAMNPYYQKMVFGCLKTEVVAGSDLSKMVEGQDIFAMKIYVHDSYEEEYVEADYSGLTEMQVTVFIKTDKSLSDIKVHYVNQNGYLEDVKVDKWEKVDGGYNVTFTVTHFSMYSVEQIESSNNNTAIIIAAVVIVLILIGLGAWYYNKNKQKA